MSTTRDFYVALETMVRLGAYETLARLADMAQALIDCDTDAEANELLDDWTGRLLLAQALPGWGWGDVGGDGHV